MRTQEFVDKIFGADAYYGTAAAVPRKGIPDLTSHIVLLRYTTHRTLRKRDATNIEKLDKNVEKLYKGKFHWRHV